MHGFVYMLASKRNGTLYVGVTSDLRRRLLEHRRGLVPGFTSDTASSAWSGSSSTSWSSKPSGASGGRRNIRAAGS